jgi:aryl-alcohol dehydrogenase-like predicted oxidoreductase
MADLPTRELGRTGLQVTMLGYGAMELRGVPRGREVTEPQAETILNTVLDAGIYYIDTSIDYGLSEGKHAGAQWERWRQAHLDDLLEGMTPMEFILRFTFTHPDMDTNIVGTVNPAHLQDNINALLQGPLPPELYAEAKRRLAAAGSTP